MADGITKNKLCEMVPHIRLTIIEVLKAGIVWKDLLSDFERRFVIETGGRYAAYGDHMVVTDGQWITFMAIASKLNVKVHAC